MLGQLFIKFSTTMLPVYVLVCFTLLLSGVYLWAFRSTDSYRKARLLPFEGDERG